MNLRDFPWRRWLSVFAVVAALLVLAAIVVPAIRDARNAARKAMSKSNLKQLGLALHNYHDVHQSFPPGGVIREDDVAMHGWYPQIMPFIDASPYFNMINFDRRWDDCENHIVFRLDIPVCKIAGVDPTRSRDGYGLMHYMGNPNVFHRNSAVTIDDMTAGTSSTWFAGEVAGNYQPWAYPFNWRPLSKPLNDGPHTFGRPTSDGACLLLADGSLRFLANDVDESVIARFADGPPVADPDKVERPSRRFRYSDWKTTTFDFDRDWEGLRARVFLDKSGTARTVSIEPKGKSSERSASCSDLKQVAEAYPAMRELFGAPAIDDDAAEILSRLEDLEVLEARSVEVSQSGLDTLRRLPRLRVLIGAAEEEMQKQLTAALPDCELRLRDSDEQ